MVPVLGLCYLKLGVLSIQGFCPESIQLDGFPGSDHAFWASIPALVLTSCSILYMLFAWFRPRALSNPSCLLHHQSHLLPPIPGSSPQQYSQKPTCLDYFFCLAKRHIMMAHTILHGEPNTGQAVFQRWKGQSSPSRGYNPVGEIED